MFKDKKITSKAFHIILILLFAITSTSVKFVNAEEIVISGNASGSASEVNLSSTSETSVSQTNDANIQNNVNLDSNTGENTASANTGGSVNVETGNSNTQLNIENSVNSSVVETECCMQETNIEIINNGSDSQNKVNFDSSSSTNVSVNQIAYVSNNIAGFANTGENTANYNTGDVSVSTGDIKVAGGVINGPINVSSVKAPLGSEGANVNIFQNGSNSYNYINLLLDRNTFVNKNFEANILNNLAWNLNTGGNHVYSTNGDVNITTGDILFDLLLKNGPINIGGVWLPCCIFDPGDKENEEPEEPNDDQEDQEEENGDDQGTEDEEKEDESEGEDGNGVGGVILAAPATSEILGLSDTSSEAARSLFFWAGVIMMALGVNFIGKELLNEKHFETAS